MRHNFGRRAAVTVSLLLTLALTAWAQDKKAHEATEGKVRAASFRYYISTVLGDAGEYVKVTRHPLHLVHDGVSGQRDEKATRALLAKFAERFKAAKVPEEDRKKLVSSAITTFDDASVQFIGANTASLTFLSRPGKDEKSGDFLVTLLLYRKDEAWQVIEEITDSTAVPPSYLLEPGKPK